MSYRHWFFVLSMALQPAVASTLGEPVPQGAAITLSQGLEALDPSGAGPENAIYSGRIVDVCRKQGCWAVLEDQGQSARLMMHDHAFSLPRDYRGPVRVLGRLQQIELAADVADHLAADAGDGRVVARVEYQIDTLGVELVQGEH